MKCDEAFDKVRMNDDYSVSVSKKKNSLENCGDDRNVFLHVRSFFIEINKNAFEMCHLLWGSARPAIQ